MEGRREGKWRGVRGEKKKERMYMNCYVQCTCIVTTNLDPPVFVPPGPFISKYLDPPEIFGPPNRILLPTTPPLQSKYCNS